MTSFDAIVIGAGHNGLVAATLLAKAGRNVCLFEAADTAGGGARTVEFAPGFRVSSLAHIVNRLHPDVVSALELTKHGWKPEKPAPTAVLDAERGAAVLHGAYGDRVEGVARQEADAWSGLRALLMRQAGVLRPFLARSPPRPGALTWADKTALGSAFLALRRLGREEMREFLRMALMNVYDVAEEHLSDDRLKGLLAFDATLGIHLGPRSPTSLLGLYYRLASEHDGVAGDQPVSAGAGGLIEALLRVAAAHGVTLRTRTGVRRILVENGDAAGVELDDGTTLRAATLLSSLDPKTTLLDLVGPRELDVELVRRVGNIRMNGCAAKLNLALDGVPRFLGLPEAARAGRIVIAGSADHVERAFNPSKYRTYSPDPVMEITLPSVADATLAPDGGCVLSAVVQFAPYDIEGGWAKAGPKFKEAILSVLESHAPGLRKSIRHTELLTPAEIETRYRMRGGHWHHGEMQADQMLLSRPIPGNGGYATPVGGLYLCGAGTHPGGGISGVPGLNSARAVIAQGGLRS